jgi:hypothetical protein
VYDLKGDPQGYFNETNNKPVKKSTKRSDNPNKCKVVISHPSGPFVYLWSLDGDTIKRRQYNEALDKLEKRLKSQTGFPASILDRLKYEISINGVSVHLVLIQNEYSQTVKKATLRIMR